MKRLSLLFLALTGSILCWLIAVKAQSGSCYAGFAAQGATTGCPATGSPTIQAYIGAFNTFLNSTYPAIFSSPQPHIPSDLEMVGMSANWIENCPTTGTCVYNSATVQESFTSLMTQSGATGVVVNLDYMPYMMSTEYTSATGYSCSATYATSTCTRLQGNLSFYDVMFLYWKAHGLTIRLAPISYGVPGGGSPWQICGLTPSTMTVAQRITCEGPYLAAMVAHNHNLSPSVSIGTVIAAHEPTEADSASTGQTLSVADWNTLLSGLCPDIHNATGGSGVLCSSGYTMADGSYATNVTGSIPTGMQAFGTEIYFRSFDSTPSWSNQPGVYTGWAAAAKTAGLAVQMDESGPPGYCPNGSGLLCNSELINGCGWPGMETYGANQAFFTWLYRYAAATGMSPVTIFYDQPFALLATGSCSSNTPNTSYTWNMLSNLPASPTVSGNSWKASGLGGSTTLFNTPISGHVSVH
jgi:hypothetical protein